MSASETCDLVFIKEMSGSEKDAGFCSGEDENLHSPSGSEDSVEVQISPISLRNKRKLAEPKKTLKADPNRPLKKRRFIERTSSPFRPWSAPEKEEDRWRAEEERRRGEEVQRLYEAQIHAQVLARLQATPNSQESHAQFRTATSQPTVEFCMATSQSAAEFRTKNLQSATEFRAATSQSVADFRAATPQSAQKAANSMTPLIRSSNVHCATPTFPTDDTPHQEEPLALVLREGRVPTHPGVSELPYEEKIPRDTRAGKIPSSRMSSTSGALSEQSATGQSQRNYKNMTRERRIEANARERTRVHTISAAFNTLRRSIPAYSHNQKLSKLSVLRIACSYIMTLSKIVTDGEDMGEGSEGLDLGECVDLVSRTIQTEGKLRKKKDD